MSLVFHPEHHGFANAIAVRHVNIEPSDPSVISLKTPGLFDLTASTYISFSVETELRGETIHDLTLGVRSF